MGLPEDTYQTDLWKTEREDLGKNGKIRMEVGRCQNVFVKELLEAGYAGQKTME